MVNVKLLTQEDLSPVLQKLESISNKKEEGTIKGGALVISNARLAHELGVSKRTLQGYRSGGKITYSKVNRRIFYRTEDVENFLLTHSNVLFNASQEGKPFSNTIKRKKNGSSNK